MADRPPSSPRTRLPPALWPSRWTVPDEDSTGVVSDVVPAVSSPSTRADSSVSSSASAEFEPAYSPGASGGRSTGISNAGTPSSATYSIPPLSSPESGRFWAAHTREEALELGFVNEDLGMPPLLVDYRDVDNDDSIPSVSSSPASSMPDLVPIPGASSPSSGSTSRSPPVLECNCSVCAGLSDSNDESVDEPSSPSSLSGPVYEAQLEPAYAVEWAATAPPQPPSGAERVQLADIDPSDDEDVPLTTSELRVLYPANFAESQAANFPASLGCEESSSSLVIGLHTLRHILMRHRRRMEGQREWFRSVHPHLWTEEQSPPSSEHSADDDWD